MKPTISVIMPIFNAGIYLPLAIESILEQTRKDFEFIILVDGSTTNDYEYIMSRKDSRIRVFNFVDNKGLTYRLNQGLDLAQGQYIARMDGDDISFPTRFEKQLALFDKGVGIVGCWGQSIDIHGHAITHFVDTECRCSNEDLKTKYPNQLCMIDASVIYIKEVKDKIGYYDTEVYNAESYNYNLRILSYFEGRVVQQPLYVRRVGSGTAVREEKIDCLSLARKRAVSHNYIGKPLL